MVLKPTGLICGVLRIIMYIMLDLANMLNFSERVEILCIYWEK
ncbi:hypothetical protein Cst_c09290 [Thermoclostridium stercorarium subsp. stercorarium DSM 8532]|uniref:Uncharacterized protein n=1 Tax=Thermoclostridium stercorarium (strain ATCC 35414 / DSM 8532 / NCIMB 11754) TaxID=1121335 RepID=L7VME9_THES1|nr:hypothetical protein Cst_c09290 [Thermoclostridium stercorarium subsp. stercorarium DSM 8532]